MLNDEYFEYPDRDTWMRECDALCRRLHGVDAILDLMDNQDAALNTLRLSFGLDHSPEQALGQMRLAQAKELWAKLGDTPVNDADEIDLPFAGFPRGTAKIAIWLWFEDTFNLSVVRDLNAAYEVDSCEISEQQGD